MFFDTPTTTASENDQQELEQKGRNNTFKTVIKRNTPRLLEPCVSNRAVGKSSYGKNAGYNEFGLNIEYQINRKN